MHDRINVAAAAAIKQIAVISDLFVMNMLNKTDMNKTNCAIVSILFNLILNVSLAGVHQRRHVPIPVRVVKRRRQDRSARPAVGRPRQQPPDPTRPLETPAQIQPAPRIIVFLISVL